MEAREQPAPSVTLWGDGSPTREFLYVEDAAEGILLAAEQYDQSDPVNLGSGREVSIAGLAVLIALEVGYRGQCVWDTARPNGQPRRCLDVTKAAERFHFHAKHALSEGIAKTVAWFLAHRTSLREVAF